MNLRFWEWGREKRDSGLSNPEAWLIQMLGGTPSDSGIPVSEGTAMRLSAVWACVKVLSESVASLPLILYQRSGESRERASSLPLYSLLHDLPNPEMTAYNFKLMMMLNLCLWGNAYALIERDRVGRILALWPAPQDQCSVTIKRDVRKQLYYEVTTTDGTVKVPGSDMFHVPGMGFNGLMGMSPIAYAKQGIGLGLAAEKFGGKFFGNGANMSGLLSTEKKLTKEAIERLREQWQSLYAGTGNAFKTPVLEEGMSYTRIGIPPDDAQFIETRKYQTVDICRIYRVPPHMVQELDRATWANIEHQGLEFVEHTLRPWLVNWEQTIIWKLLDERERRVYYAEFLVDALLRGDISSRYASYAVGRQNGWLSANDIRRMENMELIENGDVYLVPLNMVPAEQAGQGLRRPGEGGGEPVSTAGSGARSFEPIVDDAIDRVIRRIRADVSREAGRQSGDVRAMFEGNEWYQQFLEYVTRTFKPVLMVLDMDERELQRIADLFISNMRRHIDNLDEGYASSPELIRYVFFNSEAHDARE